MARKTEYARAVKHGTDDGTTARAALALLAFGMILGVLFTI